VLVSEKEDVCKKASKLREKKLQLDLKIESIEEKILGKTRTHLKKLKDQRTAAEEICKKERLALKNSSTTIEKIKRAIATAEADIHKADDDWTRLSSEATRLDQKIEAHVNQKTEYEQRLKETITEIQKITTTLEDRNKMVEELQIKLNEQRGELNRAEHQMKSLIEKLNDIEANVRIEVKNFKNFICLDWQTFSVHCSSRY
jgi:chromosome segregation ATPase